MATSDLASSVPQAVRIMRRFKHIGRSLRGTTGSRYLSHKAAKYLLGGAEALRSPEVTVCSIAWDATRLSGRETLWLACSSPQAPTA
eukprot:782597-Alexandrium_andersonii.AAC.1